MRAGEKERKKVLCPRHCFMLVTRINLSQRYRYFSHFKNAYFGCQNERERESERGLFPLLVYSPGGCNSGGLSEAGAGSRPQELRLGLTCCGRGPNACGTFHCFTQATAGAASGSSTHCATARLFHPFYKREN